MSAIGWPEVDQSTVVSITMLVTSTRAISSTSKTTITRAITAKRPITPVSEIPADWVLPTPDTRNGKPVNSSIVMLAQCDRACTRDLRTRPSVGPLSEKLGNLP